MSSERELQAWLSDIVVWGERAARHIEDLTEADFANNEVVQDAVVRCIASVGEASRHVLEKHQAVIPPDVELIQAYWTRNRLVHGYFDVDPQRVWVTATESLPRLVVAVRKMLSGL
jgi:uncharacterized protein with HEPN domain